MRRRDSASRRLVWVSCFFMELSSCFVSLRARRRISARSTLITFGTSSSLETRPKAEGSVSCRVEPLVAQCHSLELAAGAGRRPFLLPSSEPLHESADARCVGIPEEPASERRESGSHHHGQIDILRPIDHTLVERERGFVHHSVEQSILDLFRSRGSRALRAQLAQRRIDPVAPRFVVAIEAETRLLAE